MNCNRALEMMLDAEPAELTLSEATPLVVHIRTCAKCNAVAARLVSGTEALAIPARTATITRRRMRPVWVATGAAAAAAVVFAVTRWATPVLETAGRAAPPVATSEPSTPPSNTELPSPRVVERVSPPAARRRDFAAEPIRAIAVSPVHFSAPSADSAVRLIREKRNTEPSDGISVAPPAGVRATVMMTGDPTITVVWLQPADTTRSPR